MPCLCPFMLICHRNETRDRQGIAGSFGDDCISFYLCRKSFAVFLHTKLIQCHLMPFHLSLLYNDAIEQTGYK